MTHLSEEDLILLYYRDPLAPVAARTHLAECAECRGAAQSLARTLNLCSEWTVPEPEPEFERSVWARLAPSLHSVPSQGRRVLPRWVAGWSAGLALAALVMVAFIAGRSTKHDGLQITAGLTEQARERILSISLADHLDRAGMLLTEVSNASDSDTPEFASERLRAQDLVDEGRLMRQTLARDGETGTLALLDEVERFMLELANAPDPVKPEEIRELRDRIGSGSLLFKVRIIESNLRTQGQKS